MPSDHRLRFHNDQNIRPSRPYVPQRGPEETVEAVQGGSRPFSFEHGDLLPQRENFQGGIHTSAEEDADGSQECGDQMEHESTVVTSHDTCTARPRPGSQAADLNTSVTFDYAQLSGRPKMPTGNGTIRGRSTGKVSGTPEHPDLINPYFN
jgi:hypothetical protein